jgi:hypothetical protein
VESREQHRNEGELTAFLDEVRDRTTRTWGASLTTEHDGYVLCPT